ncbi:MAG: MBL fold metallo-hydrolase [Acidobacteriota bacterium]
MPERHISRHEAGDGRTVYRLPLEVFPKFWGNAYLVTGGAKPILVDTGSGHETSNRGLIKGLEAVAERFGERVEPADLGAVVLTHGHIDHMGGLAFVRPRTAAPVLVHALDRKAVATYRNRVSMVGHALEIFLAGAGVDGGRLPRYREMYERSSHLFAGCPVDETFEEGPILGGELEALHVPGHCPGQVCLRVGEVMLTADHVLADITPHLAPEALASHTGMAHYLESVRRLSGEIEGVSVGLGGHQDPIPDLAARLVEIRAHHRERLGEVLEMCASEPRSILDLSRRLFGQVESYHILLAILETGAHVEYLYDRGQLEAERGGVPGRPEAVAYSTAR